MEKYFVRAEMHCFVITVRSHMNGRVDPIRILVWCLSLLSALLLVAAFLSFVTGVLRKTDSSRSHDLLSLRSSLTRPLREIGKRVDRKHYTREMQAAYGAARSIPAAIATFIETQHGIHFASTILDVGTGTGSLAIQFAEKANGVIGIDDSPGFLELARASALAERKALRFLQMNANDLSEFPAASFDLITASQVMHWLDWDVALAGFERVLKVDAPLILIESKLVVPESNPLKSIFGVGNVSEAIARQKCEQHFDAYRALLAKKPLFPERFGNGSLWIYHEKKTFDLRYASAYLFPEQIDNAVPGDESPLAKLQRLYADLPSEGIEGSIIWLVASFNSSTRL